MEYFVLQAEKKLKKDQLSYSLPGMKTNDLNPIEMLDPTSVSVENKLLEWIIPNNQHNQSWISRHYSHFTVLKAGEEAEIVKVDIMKGMPEVFSGDVEGASYDNSEHHDPNPFEYPDRSEEVESLKKELADQKAESEIKLNEIKSEASKELEAFRKELAEMKLNSSKNDEEAKKAAIEELKREKIEELKKAGVTPPKNASLKTLDAMLAESKK